MKKVLSLFLLAAVLLLFASGLGSCNRTASSESEKPLLVVSIAPLQYLFKHIAGDQIDIDVLVPRGANPETFEPTPSDIARLHKALAYAGIGLLDFERSWADRIASECPHLATRMLFDGVELMGERERPDPHIWMSPQNMEVMAENACRFLCHIDWKNADRYRANCERLLQRIAMTDDSLRVLLPEQPQHPVTFFSYHPTLSYFARDYGLRQIPIEADGKEPSVRSFGKLARQAKADHACVIFVQPEFGARPAQWLAQETGLPIETIDPLAADWEQGLLHVATLLKQHTATAQP